MKIIPTSYLITQKTYFDWAAENGTSEDYWPRINPENIKVALRIAGIYDLEGAPKFVTADGVSLTMEEVNEGIEWITARFDERQGVIDDVREHVHQTLHDMAQDALDRARLLIKEWALAFDSLRYEQGDTP